MTQLVYWRPLECELTGDCSLIPPLCHHFGPCSLGLQTSVHNKNSLHVLKHFLLLQNIIVLCCNLVLIRKFLQLGKGSYADEASSFKSELVAEVLVIAPVMYGAKIMCRYVNIKEVHDFHHGRMAGEHGHHLEYVGTVKSLPATPVAAG